MSVLDILPFPPPGYVDPPRPWPRPGDEKGRLLLALQLLKRGDCWCEMAVGNPAVHTHSTGCLAAQDCFRGRA